MVTGSPDGDVAVVVAVVGVGVGVGASVVVGVVSVGVSVGAGVVIVVVTPVGEDVVVIEDEGVVGAVADERLHETAMTARTVPTMMAVTLLQVVQAISMRIDSSRGSGWDARADPLQF